MFRTHMRCPCLPTRLRRPRPVPPPRSNAVRVLASFLRVVFVVVGRRRVNEKTFPITTIREPLGSHLVKNRNITTHLLHEIT